MADCFYVRRLDDLGRIVIPKEIVNRYGIKHGDPLEILGGRDDSGHQFIALRRWRNTCHNCPETAIAVNIGRVALCADCAIKVTQELTDLLDGSSNQAAATLK